MTRCVGVADRRSKDVSGARSEKGMVHPLFGEKRGLQARENRVLSDVRVSVLQFLVVGLSTRASRCRMAATRRDFPLSLDQEIDEPLPSDTS